MYAGVSEILLQKIASEAWLYVERTIREEVRYKRYVLTNSWVFHLGIHLNRAGMQFTEKIVPESFIRDECIDCKTCECGSGVAVSILRKWVLNNQKLWELHHTKPHENALSDSEKIAC